MGSTHCQKFVQNAWKKDLCSNCFKSRDEHTQAQPARPNPRPAPPAGTPVQGILKGIAGSWTRKKSHKVFFPAEECEVIGEGGEDAGPPSDEEDHLEDDDDDWSSPLADENPQDREEEKLLLALTRSNTDFNSVASNLLEVAPPAQQTGDSRKTRAQLQLGKPLKDSEGKKQTLLVSVQPFGGKPAATSIPEKQHVTKIHTGDIGVQEKIVQLSTTSITHSETKQRSDQGSVDLKSVVHTNPEANADRYVSPNLKVPFEPHSSASAEDVTKKQEQVKSVVVSSENGYSGDNGRVNGLASSLKQSSDAQATAEKKSSTSPQSKTVVDAVPQISSKHIFLKSIVETESDATETKVNDEPSAINTVTTNGKSEVYVSPARREGKRTHITRGTPISKSNELLLKTKFIPLRTSAILNKNNSDMAGLNKPTNKVEALKNERNEADSNAHVVAFQLQPREVVLKVAPTASCKVLESSDEDDHTYSNVQVRKCDEESEGVQTKRLSSLLAATLSVGSRELAGEPDGRADPDSSSESSTCSGEPPALPQSPPPAVDPRPSFLHGLTARMAAADKPKVPFKSNTVVQAACASAALAPRWLPGDPPTKSTESAQPLQALSCGPPSPSPKDSPQGSPETTPLSSRQGSPQSSPQSSPQGSPQGSGDALNRSQKRQAPKPPQTPSDDTTLADAGGCSPSTTLSELEELAVVETSASTAPSSLFYRNRVITTTKEAPVAREKDKRRGLQHSPPMRSESVPSALGQVALGQSVTLGARSGSSIAQALAQAQAHAFVSMSPAPQPSPRRALSLSTDSLTSPPAKHVLSYDTERKKVGTKVRFSLRKFLGLTKDGVREEGSPLSGETVPNASSGPPQPRPRPRLEIIHPSDLSGTAVEVLRGSGLEVRRQLQEAAQATHRRNSDVSSDCSASPGSPGILNAMGGHCNGPGEQADRECGKGRPSKPPPPPRAQSLDSDRADTAGIGRPSRPPPPKSSDLLKRQKQPPSPPVAPSCSVYANLAPVAGEMRSGLAPLKPQRTGSVRDAALDGPKRTPLPAVGKDKDPPKMPVRSCSLPMQMQPEDSGYESVELSDAAQPQSMTYSENVYECVNGTGDPAERSSSPECDSARPGLGTGSAVPLSPAPQGPSAPVRHSQQRRSEVLETNTSDYPRLGFSSFGRSASVTYCGSETESDIYSPYSFYGSEEGDDGEADSSLPPSANQAPWKWHSRGRKGRSIVHKSMEDNYGAVVGANHEALAQLLEQIRTGPTVPPPLRPIKSLPSLSWCDFSLEPAEVEVVAGHWVFLAAQWGSHPVTLSVLPDHSPAGVAARVSRGPFALMPIAEFRDFVPSSCLPQVKRPYSNHVQAYVGVLARIRVETLSSYGAWLRAEAGSGAGAGSGGVADPREEVWREAGVALLQLVNALKALQAMGTEEVSTDSVVFLRDPGTSVRDSTAQLAVLYSQHHSPDEEIGLRSLCQCALTAVEKLLPSAPTFGLLTTVLGKERAESLSRAKSVLEFWLWGPGSGIDTPAPGREREAALQRWLDLERATVLHRLVCARAAPAAGASSGPRLAIHQQSHLLFLVHTSAKTMCDASQLLNSHSIAPLEPSAV